MFPDSLRANAFPFFSPVLAALGKEDMSSLEKISKVFLRLGLIDISEELAGSRSWH
jgi:hypothetical protein